MCKGWSALSVYVFLYLPLWRTREETKTKTVRLQGSLFVVARHGLEVLVGAHWVLYLQFLALDYMRHCFPLDPDGQKEQKNNWARSCTAAKHFRDCFFFFFFFFLKRRWFSSVLFKLLQCIRSCVQRLCRIHQKNGCVKAARRGQAHFVSRLQAVGRHVPRLPPAGAQNTAAHATNRCLHAPLVEKSF